MDIFSALRRLIGCDRARALGGSCLALLTFGAAGACSIRPRDALHPIPDQPTAVADTLRGTAARADVQDDAAAMAVMREVMRSFFRPIRGQARWIDPQPLAHRRTAAADSLAPLDEDWALAIVQASAVGRVCLLNETDHECRGRPGGVLRFSRVYFARPDSAIVFARYDAWPRPSGRASRSRLELELWLRRDSDGWHLDGKRTLTAP